MISKLLTVIIVATSIWSCDRPSSQEEKEVSIKYFTNLTGIISPYLDYKPRGQITPKDTLSLNHYRVSYDEQGRLDQLAFFHGVYPSDGAYYGTHKVKYKYTRDKISRTYFNKAGGKSHTWRHYYMGGDIHEERFLLDGNKNKKELLLFDSLGERVQTGLGSYVFRWETVDEKTFIQKQFGMNNTAVVLTEYFPFPISRIDVDSLGHLYSIDNVDENGQLIMQQVAGYARVVFDFDEYGNELGWRFYDTDGVLADRKPFKEMDYGYAQWLYQADWKDRSLGLAKSFKENYFSKDNNPVENNLGIHEVQYQRNSFGNTTTLEYYNLEHNKQIHPNAGYFRLEFEYDDKGQRIGTKKYDSLGNHIQ